MFSGTIPPNPNPLRQSSGARMTAEPSAVSGIDVCCERGAGLRRICVWPTLGAKRGKGSRVGFGPIFQGFQGEIIRCQLWSGRAGQARPTRHRTATPPLPALRWFGTLPSLSLPTPIRILLYVCAAVNDSRQPLARWRTVRGHGVCGTDDFCPRAVAVAILRGLRIGCLPLRCFAASG